MLYYEKGFDFVKCILFVGCFFCFAFWFFFWGEGWGLVLMKQSTSKSKGSDSIVWYTRVTFTSKIRYIV